MAKLYFSYSTMNAGKSTLLLQASYNYRERGMRTLLYTSSLYAKGDVGLIESRIGISAEAELFSATDDLFDLIRQTPHLTWLLLTKRPGNIVKLWGETGLAGCEDFGWPGWPRNAAIGCTVVTHEEADRDIPKLLAAKAALNPAFAFVSMEQAYKRF